jgi:hypothetical protein
MDAFKLTFETTIVGISAFLWLGIAIDLISPTFLPRIKSYLDGTNQSVVGAVLLATAYGLGSAILPISAQLVNDEHWPLPEDAIRCRVAEEEEGRLKLVNYSSLSNLLIAPNHGSACASSLWNRIRGGGKTNPNGTPTATLARNEAVSEEQLFEAHAQQKTILAKFEVLENRALGQGTNREELFRQLRERMIVLRGAVFSGFILFLICLFGCIAPERDQPINRWRAFLGIMLASSLTIFVIHNGLRDLQNPSIFDIPILEGVLGAISVFGGFLAVRGVRRRSFLGVQFLLVIAVGAAFSYGGWIWSEVLYDQQVIASSAVSLARPEAAKIQSGGFSDRLPSKSGSTESVQ